MEPRAEATLAGAVEVLVAHTPPWQQAAMPLDG